MLHARWKTCLPCCSSAFSGGSESGSGNVPARTASDSAADPLVREEQPLERAQVVEDALGNGVLHLRVRDQGPMRLLLERSEAGIQLIAAGRIGVAEPRVLPVIAGERHVVDAGHHAPDVDEGFARHETRGRVHELHVLRQRQGDADETVFPQIAEVVSGLAAGAEIIRVDGAKERVVRIAIEMAAELQELEPRFHVRGRELEAVARHVAVGAGAAVAVEAVQTTIEESKESADDSVAGLAAAGRNVGR